jgi:hypothetical protein
LKAQEEAHFIVKERKELGTDMGNKAFFQEVEQAEIQVLMEKKAEMELFS